jgi:hypothetical protein
MKLGVHQNSEQAFSDSVEWQGKQLNFILFLNARLKYISPFLLDTAKI